MNIGVSIDDYSKFSLKLDVLLPDGTHGTISSIAAYPDESTRTYKVQILLPKGSTCAMGDMIQASLVIGTDTKCYVPISAVFEVDGLDYIYIVEGDGRIARRQVQKGEVSGTTVELDGVEAGLTVVTDGLSQLKENDVVSTGDAAGEGSAA